MHINVDLSYPRPLCRRKSFIDLNGEWDFYLEDYDVGEKLPRYKSFPKNHLKINVPFCYQSELSGINISTRYDTVWYHRQVKFNCKDNQRVILHIGACDYKTSVYVNSILVGTHLGGYTAFNFDITHALINNVADIVIRVDDSYDVHQPRGKQKWRNENFGCWYQEVTGIWKPVWAEIVEDTYIKSVKLTPNENSLIEAELNLNKTYSGKLVVEVMFDNRVVCSETFEIDGVNIFLNIPLTELHFWSIEEPNCYIVRFKLPNGEQIETLFGYRFINTSNGQILLNGKPIFMRLTLEQGYYKEGIYTFKDETQMIDEIRLIRDSGFNGLRLHQKVEDERFYYLCDILGLIVWSEMPSCYDFDATTKINVKREWTEIINEHYNHPSILVWTPLNESWGVPAIRVDEEQQDFAVELYNLTKSIDKTRLVVSNDGWEHCKTDLVTLHNYLQEPERFKSEFIDVLMDIIKENRPLYKDQIYVPFASKFKYEGQPILIDEFCGIGFNIDQVDNGWGYGDKVDSINAFLQRYDGLVKLVTTCPLLSGWCMTQISDVYQEVNGLFTFNRRSKFPIEELNKINTQKR